MNIFVAFTDSSEAEIESVFSGIQSQSDFNHLGTIDENDTRYIEFIKTFPINVI